MAEVGEEWIWLVYRCSHFFWGGGVAHLTQNNVPLKEYLFSYSRNGFDLSFLLKNFFMSYSVCLYLLAFLQKYLFCFSILF